MRIEVLGTGCARCNTTEAVVREAVQRGNVPADVVKVHDIAKIAEYAVVVTPAVVIDGQVMSTGRIPSIEEVLDWISN